MPKNKISEYSTTNSANTDIESINIDEGCPPSSINNAIRELMVHLKEFQTGSSGDPLTVAGGMFISGGGSANTLTVTGILTASGGTILSSTNTLSGSNIISGNINSSGTTNTFSGGNILSGTNTISGSAIISGNINSSGTTNTFSGGNIFSGTNTMSGSTVFSSGNLKLAGSSSGTATLNAPAAASTNTYTLPPDTSTLGYRNVPAVGTKTGSYTLATTDVGEYVQVGSGGSITIPDATFAEGDVISIFNNTASGVTITCSITTAYIAGTDSDKATVTLATRGVCTVLFISSTVCVITGNVS
jgi:fibronectin-binding autotransporter adhesin